LAGCGSGCVSCLVCRGRCNSNLPPVVPAAERRALSAIPEPSFAVTPGPGATPFGSAPSVGSRPPDPDGRTRDGTTALSIAAAQRANGTWFGNRLLRTRTTGFSLGCRGRSIFGHVIAIRASIRDLSRDHDRADNQDRSQNAAPHPVPSTLRFSAILRPGGVRQQGPSPRAVITSYHRIGSRIWRSSVFAGRALRRRVAAGR
jgi:hypothetical protein